MYEVWRIEVRHEDAIDFWDYTSQEQAERWGPTHASPYPFTIRKLSEQELIETALASYKDLLE